MCGGIVNDGACAKSICFLIPVRDGWNDFIRLCESMIACTMLFDNVDWQEHYERFYYTPEKDNGDTGNPEIYDKIGWTQVWQERYGEK